MESSFDWQDFRPEMLQDDSSFVVELTTYRDHLDSLLPHTGELRGQSVSSGNSGWQRTGPLNWRLLNPPSRFLQSDRISPAVGPRTDANEQMATIQNEHADHALVSERFEPDSEPASDCEWCARLVESGVPPLIAETRIQFRRDLPILRTEHPGKRVAYSGAERIAIADTKRELVVECLQRGLKVGDFLVQAIVAEEDVGPSETDTTSG
jgi:hypothetical protein